MKCPICRKGETAPGSATVALERGGLALVVKAVPAQVCENCGEETIHEEAAAPLLAQVEAETRAGSQIHVRQFRAA